MVDRRGIDTTVPSPPRPGRRRRRRRSLGATSHSSGAARQPDANTAASLDKLKRRLTQQV